jgi:hypothetical protein
MDECTSGRASKVCHLQRVRACAAARRRAAALTGLDVARGSAGGDTKAPVAGDVTYLYEPGADKIFAELPPTRRDSGVSRAAGIAAAEHAARMTATDAARRTPAKSSITSRDMNKVRQAAITREIIEVVSGAPQRSRASGCRPRTPARLEPGRSLKPVEFSGGIWQPSSESAEDRQGRSGHRAGRRHRVR